MRHPQIVVFETDGALAAALTELANERRWLLRESRQAPACLNLLRSGGPAVLVLKLGRHLVRELTFLDEVHAALPHVPIVAVTDSEDATVMSLTLELGARFVMQPRPQLVEVVARLLESRVTIADNRAPQSLPIALGTDESES